MPRVSCYMNTCFHPLILVCVAFGGCVPFSFMFVLGAGISLIWLEFVNKALVPESSPLGALLTPDLI